MAGERLNKPINVGDLELPSVPTEHVQMLRIKTENGTTIFANPNHNSLKKEDIPQKPDGQEKSV